MRTLCACLLLTISFAASAQQLTGFVRNEQGLAIAFAEVMLTDSSSQQLFKIELADSTGLFTITNHTGATNLVVTAQGYVAKNLELKQVNISQPIAVILQQLSGQLDEVTITSSKPMFERKTDRIVFNISNSIVATGSTVLDAVARSPGVIVNQATNSIALVGKAGVQVMVNGKLLNLSGEDLVAYLQSQSASRLERIEVITAPPAQYDAAGNSGLINLVLKKDATQGVNGNIRAGIEQSTYPTALGGGAINYRNGKLNLYANGNMSLGSKGCREKLTSYYTGREFSLEDHYRKDIQSGQLTAGADYDLNKGSVLGVQYTGNIFNKQYTDAVKMLSYTLPARSIDSLIRQGANSIQERTNHIVNLNYEWAIDTTGKKISLNANRLWLVSDRSRYYNAVGYVGNSDLPTGFSTENRNEGDQQIDITTAQADMELPTKWAQLSFGGKLTFITNESGNKFYSLTQGGWQEETAISNRFNYKEEVQALYASMQKEVNKWSLQAGLRTEFTKTTGKSLSLLQTVVNHYAQLFPSLYVGYTPSENHMFNISYTKRVNRPGYNDLDPFRSYSSPYSYTEGNPFLRPSLNHNLELNYTLKSRYTFTGYYEYVDNHFGQVFLVDSAAGDNYVTRANFGNLSAYGLNFMASFQPLPWWETQMIASAFVQQVHSNWYTSVPGSYSKSGVFLQTTNSFAINKDRTLTAELSMYYMSPNQPEFLRFRSSGSVDAGIRAQLFEKKLTVTLNATDIFRTQLVRGTHLLTRQELDSYFDARNIRLMLQYKLGGKVREARKRETGIEAEKART